jgi:UDP-N-acetylmuramate dehydrogenase
MSWRSRANLDWLASLPGVRTEVALDRQTSLNVGGPAEHWIQPAQPAPLVEECHRRGIPYFLLGAGTNLLIADGGIEGLVIRCADRECRREGDQVYAAAGLKMMRLARFCAEQGLTGCEWAIGVPGTVGGAVYQNAGCWGGQLADVLVSAQGFQPGVGIRAWDASELVLGYRDSALRSGPLHGCLLSGAWIQLAPGDGEAAKVQMARWVAERSRTQPIRTKNCGSVFKNPAGDSAGRLVEEAGLKGAQEGGAMVSEQHANFIVNVGGASATDVARLIERVQHTVARQFGLELETEVEKVGRW